jgi:hypothetical protein
VQRLLGIAVVLVAAGFYGLLTSIAFERHRWRGALAVLSVPTLANLIWGTVSWLQPHTDVAAVTTRTQDWWCHATDFIPSNLFFAAAVLVTITVTSHASFRQQRAYVIGSAMVVVLPALWLGIPWVIGVLGCDAL